MTFRRQVRRALAGGLAAGAAGVGLAFGAVVLEAFEVALWPDVAGIGAMVLMAGGAMVVLAGALARPLQRLAFRHGMPAGRLRALALRWPVLRWWLWVDEGGRDRDG